MRWAPAPHTAAALGLALDQATELAVAVATQPEFEDEVRRAASALYYVTAAITMAWEATQPGVNGKRLLWADALLRTHLQPRNPVAVPSSAMQARDAAMLAPKRLTMAQAAALLEAVGSSHPAADRSAAALA